MINPEKKEFLHKPLLISVVEGVETKQKFDIDTATSHLLGVRIDSDVPTQALYRGSFGLRISDVEVVPEGTIGQTFMFGQDCPTRFFALGEWKNGNNKVDIVWKDSANASLPFQPHQVWFTFLIRKT